MIGGFEDLLIWRRSKDLAILIYKIFKDNKDYSFKDQIERAVISISNNIAEGHEKGSKRDFVKFLYIAKGSCGEVRSMIVIALELGYIDKHKYESIYSELKEISKMIGGLIKKLG